ncbi:hypothetical protein K435DRAFT_861819 [Dendrothele bispora CBS 962.96]|uniref:CxC2-like cysteine cluster KDZ transposase-associated domain-containing protein n=1 Tax=Dendrothele bispora (strain CBS 962.96) TaxID=1314807 RepID=A0A4S8LVG3_DENBC|nr:hypothetical protein K435DRAFT_861819 [Dendrothele bispora CBS 962.96]
MSLAEKVAKQNIKNSNLQKGSLGHFLAPELPCPTLIAESLSEDGRRTKWTLIPVEPLESIKKRREDAQREAFHQLTNVNFGDRFENTLATIDKETINEDDLPDAIEREAPEVVVVEEVKARRRYLSSDEPLKQWIAYRDEYLSELIRGEGRGNIDTECCCVCGEQASPGNSGPLYCCRDCIYPDLMCEDCCRSQHQDRPFDCVEKWNGHYFKACSLKDLGITLELGHRRGEICTNKRIINNFTVIHVNGIHTIRAAFCDCAQKFTCGEFRQQLLRHEFFPATHIDPHTCATFKVLNHFHVMTLQGKVTTYDYYNGLEKIRNNAGLSENVDQYEAFSQMIRLWRHLKMLKRAGQGNDASRPVEQTDGPEEERFKYWLFFAIDACFRLKRRMVSSDERDPGLGTGWSYFVEDKPFKEFLATVTDQDEMCTCNGLAALQQANTRYSRGYSSTGCGLGKGERYANMDWIVACLLQHHDPRLTKVFSYDIACQWCRHIIKHLLKLPPLLRLNLIFHIVYFVVPKLHIYGHQILCQLHYSLNWLWGAGRTDGEGIERPWAHMGPVATSTRDMGPGSRHDTMDDHWGHWNWCKLINLGTLLLRRLLTAILERLVHTRALKEFTQHQEKFRPGVTTEWKKMIREWEAQLVLPVDERTKQNPFEMPKSGLTEAEIKLQLTALKAEQEKAGIPSLQIEEQQLGLKLDLKNKMFETALQKLTLIQLRTKISRALGKWRGVQGTYCPGALQVLSKQPSHQENPEDIQLYLPSELPLSYHADGCRPGLLEIEKKLREAQLCHSLNQLRNHLHMKARLLTYWTTNVAHQSTVTRSQSIFMRNQRQIDGYARRYQAAWKAMVGIVGQENMMWRKLEDQDIRLMNGSGDRAVGNAQKQQSKKGKEGLKEGLEDENKYEELTELASESAQRLKNVRSQLGEGQRESSWIWMEGGTGQRLDDETLEEIIWVEWCKSYARAQKWNEEVILVKEEMRRCLVTLEYLAKQWDGRETYEGPLSQGKSQWKPEWKLRTDYVGPLSTGTDKYHSEGVRAYAHSQGDLYRRLAGQFRKLWANVGQKEKDLEEGKGLTQAQRRPLEQDIDQQP